MINKFHAPIACIVEFKKQVGNKSYQNAFLQVNYFVIPKQMNIEEKVKMNLLTRGFDNKTQLNNRGLIGATIDETILEVVKNLLQPYAGCFSQLALRVLL